MRRAALVPLFIAIVVLVFVTFAPAGAWLAERAYDYHVAHPGGSGLAPVAPLLAADAAGLAAALVVSLAGGAWLPSGLPHVFFALFLPLTLAAAQARYFELTGPLGTLGERFGAYNFPLVFVLTIVLVQVGVSLARARDTRRHGAHTPS